VGNFTITIWQIGTRTSKTLVVRHIFTRLDHLYLSLTIYLIGHYAIESQATARMGRAVAGLLLVPGLALLVRVLSPALFVATSLPAPSYVHGIPLRVRQCTT